MSGNQAYLDNTMLGELLFIATIKALSILL